MTHNNFSHLSTAAVPFGDNTHPCEDPSDVREVPYDYPSVKEVKEGAGEGQDITRSPSSVPEGQDIVQRNEDLAEERSVKMPRRRYLFFPGSPSKDPGPPPDGGTTAWLQVLAGHLMCFIT